MSEPLSDRRRLAGRTCVVTGSSGMAADAVLRFRSEGAQVVGVAKDADECEALGPPYLLADLSDEEQTVAAFAAARRMLPRLDAVYAVAGGSGRRLGDVERGDQGSFGRFGQLALAHVGEGWVGVSDR